MTFTDAQTAAALAATADEPLQMDEDAFRGFYERTSRMLWAYLERLSGDRQLADDLLQETYYRFLRSATVLDGEAHRRHYLFRIATNLVRDGHRRRRTRPTPMGHEYVENAAAPGIPQSSVDRRLDLTRAMARLKPRDRALLWLAYGQGASHREIAEVVGVGHASVKPLLFRARRKLAGFLGRTPRGDA
jgi:RNA polymerase sigma-70 factor (ECF subfamily)